MPWEDKSKYRSDAYREYMRNYQKDWHQQNKAQRLARAHERKEQLRVFYNKLKENLECAQCGENHPATIQFHHRDPQQKDFNLSAAVRQGYSAERIKREMAKCTVLCANCHAKLHYDWAAKNREPFREGLASQFLEIEEALSVSQEEKLAHAVVNQYIPAEVDLDLYDDPNVGL
jgi:transcription elongation factor Elf1